MIVVYVRISTLHSMYHTVSIYIYTHTQSTVLTRMYVKFGELHNKQFKKTSM